MENQKIRVAITHGDTNGTGYELILKAFEDPTMLELCTPIVYGSPKVAAYHAKALGIETQFTIINDVEEAKEGRLNLLNCINEEVKVEFGQTTTESSAAAQKALEHAFNDYQKGQISIIVSAPAPGIDAVSLVQKRLEQIEKPLTIRCSEDMRIALMTNHLALKDVPEAITKQEIIRRVKMMHQSLRRDMNISAPRIAVLALNPHVEDDLMGEEEKEMIIPAIQELEESGLLAFGPYAADDYFGNSLYLRFDGVLAMYYDQGMIPFKSLAREGSVDYTTGLPLILVAPADGDDMEEAGKNTKEPLSMLHAIYMAIDVWRHQKDYDEPLKNPLPKLYHEKRDDSEKVRFRSVEKKTDDKEKKEETQEKEK